MIKLNGVQYNFLCSAAAGKENTTKAPQTLWYDNDSLYAYDGMGMYLRYKFYTPPFEDGTDSFIVPKIDKWYSLKKEHTIYILKDEVICSYQDEYVTSSPTEHANYIVHERPFLADTENDRTYSQKTIFTNSRFLHFSSMVGRYFSDKNFHDIEMSVERIFSVEYLVAKTYTGNGFIEIMQMS